jgi:hypothetical protein
MPNSPNDIAEDSHAIVAADQVSSTGQGVSNPFLLYPENQKYLDRVLDKPLVNMTSPWVFALGWAAVVSFITTLAMVPFFLDRGEKLSLLGDSLFFGLPALAFGVLFFRRLSDRRHLFQEGQVLDGRALEAGITGNEKMKFWFDMVKSFTRSGERVVLSIWVRYLFRSPAGKALYGYERVGQKFDRGVPAPDTAVKVLYFSDRNFRIL